MLGKSTKKVSVSRNFSLSLHCQMQNGMELQHKFRVILHREAQVFLKSLDEKTRSKILQTFDRASLLLDPEVFKKLADTDIWEFRTTFNKQRYRVLAFWDKTKHIDTLVIATHGLSRRRKRRHKKKSTRRCQ